MSRNARTLTPITHYNINNTISISMSISIQINNFTQFRMSFKSFIQFCLVIFHGLLICTCLLPWSRCSPFNSEEALEKAKRAVEENYSVVGVLEDLNTTLSVLENYVPRFFRGVSRIYHGLWHFSKICLSKCLSLHSHHLIVIMLISNLS